MEWGEEWWVGPACERRLHRGVRLNRAIFPGKNIRCGDIEEVHTVCCLWFLHRHILFSKEEKKRKDEENPKWSRYKTTLYDKKVFFVSFIYEIWSMRKIGLLLYVKIMIVFFCV
jgi:hypothetical protein